MLDSVWPVMDCLDTYDKQHQNLFLERLITFNEKPLRTIKRKLQTENNPPTLNQLPHNFTPIQCINSKCLGYNIISCERDGYYVCIDCGSVCSHVPMFQELDPFFYKSIKCTGHSSPDCSENKRRPKYSRLFHFNEILAAFNIQGPRIDNRDMEVIKKEILESGIDNPGKLDIQRIQRLIDNKYKVERFSRRYGEKWIQIKYRIFKKRPEPMSHYLITRLRHIFKTLWMTWPYVRHLVKGSRKNRTREQWPNFTVTLSEILKRKFPSEWEKYKDWLPLLSEKKLKQLAPCFDQMFFMADVDNEISEIEDDSDDENDSL